jgi:hypothetical protein
LPGVFAGVQTGDLAKVQAKIDSGDWAQSVQAGDWAGYAIAEVLDIDVSDNVQKECVKKMLAAWIESGALKVLQRPSPKTRGRNRPSVVIGNRVAGPEVDET